MNVGNLYADKDRKVLFSGNTRCEPNIAVWGSTNEYRQHLITLVAPGKGIATVIEMDAFAAKQLAEIILAAVARDTALTGKDRGSNG